jgi:type IV pilus assembly protein PilC
VSNGWSLSYSLTQRGERKLPVTFIETIRSGEESGDLVGAFARMSDYYDRMQKTRAKAASAMIYPAFVLGVAVVVVAVIMTYAIPAFAKTFESMNMELPLVTKLLIAVSNFTRAYILHIVAALALAAFCLRLYGGTQEGGQRFARLKLRLPILGKIAQMTGASQFAHTMSTMLSAGMPILQALEVSGRSMSNACMAKAIAETIPGVEGGRTLGECMSHFSDLPDMLVQMTAVGEATGSLEATLEILAEYYDNEVDTLTAKALSLLEPIIIVFLAVIVVTLLLAVYLPMFSMYGAM